MRRASQISLSSHEFPWAQKEREDCNQDKIESLRVRVREAIHRSNTLINQSNVLQALTVSFLKCCEAGIAEGEGHFAVQVRRHPYWSDRARALKWAVDAALRISGAPMGNLQLYDPVHGTLKIAAQYGFGANFLTYFDTVRKDQTACAKAYTSGRRLVVEDVVGSEVFPDSETVEVLLDAGVRAVQSTPLVAPSGATIGVLSTHWPSPLRPSQQALHQFDQLASIVSNFLSAD